ncbi:Chemotaxis protein CheW [bioreactor metagenome]|uniref:Chemotaxis protein CheW n=1 Tax=bioreactor metagenome TaxID=1076179 RepID=A0A645F8D2_9ZZZZ
MEANEELTEQQEDTQHGRYLTFNLGEEVFGLEIRYVTEIIGLQPITRIPEVAAYIKGIINLRGKIIPVIDMRLKFGKEPVEYNDRTCIIVIDTQELVVGLIVDRVSEVVTIEDDSVVPPPDQRTGIKNRYIQGIGTVDGNVKLLLDCKMLLDSDETQEINEIV